MRRNDSNDEYSLGSIQRIAVDKFVAEVGALDKTMADAGITDKTSSLTREQEATVRSFGKRMFDARAILKEAGLSYGDSYLRKRLIDIGCTNIKVE